MSHCRNVMRQSALWMNEDVDASEKQKALHRVRCAAWAFPRCLASRLSGPEDELPLRAALETRLDAVSARRLLRAPNRPLQALADLARAMNACQRREAKGGDGQVGHPTGRRARDVRTDIHEPRAVGVHPAHSPFPVVLAAAPAVGAVGTVRHELESSRRCPGHNPGHDLLLRDEELAVQLEEPFSILPLSKLCDSVWDGGLELFDEPEPCENNPGSKVAKADAVQIGG